MLLTGLDVAGALAVTLHVLAHRTDVRAAAGWIALAWLSPFVGSLLYVFLGINRIARRASRLRRGRAPAAQQAIGVAPDGLVPGHLSSLGILTERVSGVPLTPRNRLQVLENGDEAYPAMLEAIRAATSSVLLASYIFRADEAGRPFVDALGDARRRGVDVRVLVDGLGAGYFKSPASDALRAANVPVARFLHTWLPWRMPFLNLRLHKKILVVDDRVGFTGGMNIGSENVGSRTGRAPAVRDVHFRVSGPVVADLSASFEQDWAFVTGERARGRSGPSGTQGDGQAFARGVQSGPDDDVMKIEMILVGAINAARTRIRVVSPYFLPDRTLQSALVFAALRGVSVEVVIPRVSNHRIVDWSTRAQIGTLLANGCQVHLSPAPLDHSKIMTVDGLWSFVGSANWDVRSLRLNFEFNLEIWDADFTRDLDALIEAKIEASRPLTPRSLAATPAWARLRNAAARLLLPYL